MQTKKEVCSLISTILLHDTAQKHQTQRMKLKTSSFTCYALYTSVTTCWKRTFQTRPSLDTRTRPLGTHTHRPTTMDCQCGSKTRNPKNKLWACASDTSVCFWHFWRQIAKNKTKNGLLIDYSFYSFLNILIVNSFFIFLQVKLCLIQNRKSHRDSLAWLIRWTIAFS